MKKQSLFAQALLVLAIFGMVRCSQDDAVDVAPKEDSFTVKAKNGYLEFKDWETIKELQATQVNQSFEDLNAWEDQFSGFTSLRTLQEKADQAQEGYYASLEKLDQATLESMKASQDQDFYYDEFLRSHPDKFILEEEGFYRLNFHSIGLGHMNLLNEDGMMKVGDTLFLYNNNSIRSIVDGDESKLSLLKNSTESDLKQGIVVQEVLEEVVNFVPDHATNISGRWEETNANYDRFFDTRSCSDDDGDDRVKSFTYEGRKEGSGAFAGNYKTYFAFRAENWRKNGIFGGWNKKRTGQFRVTGWVECYHPYYNRWERRDVSFITNGDVLAKEIYFEPWLQSGPWLGGPVEPVDLTTRGSIEFEARGDTSCTI